MSIDAPLRVAYLARYLPSASETFVLDEALALHDAGAEVKAWALDHARDSVRHRRHERLYKGGTAVPRASSFRTWGVPRLLTGSEAEAEVQRHFKGLGRARELRRIRWLASTWRSLDVDVVRIHHAAEVARYGIAAAMLADLPVSLAVHARDLFVPEHDLIWLLRSVHHITTITPFHRESLLRLGLPGERVQILPCAVNVPEAPAAPPEPGRKLRILSVGRLVPKKGHELLIEACRRVAERREVELWLVGSGPLEHTLRQQAAAAVGYGLTVRFLGSVPNEEVEILLSGGRFHAAVLACRVAEDGDRDGLPVSLIEAQGHGLPIVSAALPGFEQGFGEGSGAVLLPIDENGQLDVAELAAELDRLAVEPARQRLLAERGRDAARRRLGPRGVGQALLGMLCDLCSRVAPGPDQRGPCRVDEP